MRQLLLVFVLLFLLLNSQYVLGQVQVPDSLRAISRDITTRLQQRPSDGVLVVQVRELLREQAQTGNVRNIPRLLAYLQQNTADTTVSLRPYEEWGLRALAGDMYMVSKQIRDYGQKNITPQQTRHYQRLPQDGLFALTRQRMKAREDTLRTIIQQTRFLPEDSTFLQLFVTLLVPTDSAAAKTAGQTQNALIRDFLARYPESEYNYCVRQFATPEYTVSHFSYGLDFHSGSGILLGNLPTYFRHGANFGHGFEFGWDRYQLYLRNYIGIGRTRQELEYEGTWRSGMKVNYFMPEVSVGYLLVDKSRLRLTPFAGLAAFFISPVGNVKDNPEAALNLGFRRPITVGVNVDVPLWSTSSYGQLRGGGREEVGSWMLKLRAGVRQGPARHRSDLKGGIIYLDLGIGGFGRIKKPKPL